MPNSSKPFAVFAVAWIPGTPFIAATSREDGSIALPGGKVEDGEDPFAAVERESMEEGWRLQAERKILRSDFVDGKLVWWISCAIKTPAIVTGHKEAHRGIHPVSVSPASLSPGFGNEWLRVA